MDLEINRILKQALAENPTCDAELDVAIEKACDALYSFQAPDAQRATKFILDRYAKQKNTSRLKSAAKLARAKIVSKTHTYTSVDQMPPDVRQRFEQMKRDGQLDSTLETNIGGVPIRTKNDTVGRLMIFGICLLVAVLVVFTPIIVHVWKSDTVLSPGKRIEKLEQRLKKSPDNIDVAIELAAGYLRQLRITRALAALGDLAADRDDELAKKMKRSIVQMEARTGVEGSKDAAFDLAEKGETLMLDLLDRKRQLSDSQRTNANLMLGHFLIEFNELADARAASDRAAAINPNDPRVNMLNADIYEEQKRYQQAVEENDLAAAKVAVYLAKQPSWQQELQWALTSGSTSTFRQKTAWKKQKQKIAKAFNTQIQMHNLALRALVRCNQLKK